MPVFSMYRMVAQLRWCLGLLLLSVLFNLHVSPYRVVEDDGNWGGMAQLAGFILLESGIPLDTRPGLRAR
jgi:hypothetical protein